MSKARIAIIGTGSWSATAHFPALAAHPDAEIAAICDHREDALKLAADAFGIANIGSTGNSHISDPGALDLQVNCERGRLDLDFISGAGLIRHADGSAEFLQRLDTAEAPPGADQPDELYPLFATATNLVDVITGKSPNGSPAEIGWRTVELLDAAYRSAALGGQAVAVTTLYTDGPSE